jgi:hypothetical protein
MELKEESAGMRDFSPYDLPVDYFILIFYNIVY